jgi:hypothetical protein
VWKKSILFCTFSRFGGFFRLQVLVRQALADAGRLPKKSCRKTYRRLFAFRGLWHNRAMNDEHEEKSLSLPRLCALRVSARTLFFSAELRKESRRDAEGAEKNFAETQTTAAMARMTMN